MNQDLLAPHSIEAEEQLLGVLVALPHKIIDVQGLLAPDDFFILRHTILYQELIAIKEQYGEGIGIDLLIAHLKAVGKLEAVGGQQAIQKLATGFGTTQQLEFFAKLIKHLAVRRRLIELSTAIAQEASTGGDKDEVGIIQDAIAQLAALAQDGNKQRVVSHQEVSMDYLAHFERVIEGTAERRTVPTGLSSLDAALFGGGLPRGGLTTIKASYSVGKSALMYNIAVNAARKGYKVAIVSIEMTARDLIARMVASLAKVPTHKQYNAEALDGRDIDSVTNALTKYSNLPITYIENCYTPTDIEAMAQRLAISGLDMLVIDYAQIINVYGVRKNGSRQQEIGFLTQRLKQIAMSLDIAVITASQVNDSGQAREARDIENDSDLVLHLQVPEGMTKDQQGERWLDIEKQRQAALKRLEIIYMPQLVLFGDKAYE